MEEENKYHFAREVLFNLKSCNAITGETYWSWFDKLIEDEEQAKNNGDIDLVSKPFICGNCLISEDKCECKKPLDFGMVEEYYDEKRKCWATRLVKD